jgi:hypothetical protein
MSGWRIASESDNTRSWHSSAIEGDERSTKLPIKPGDRIKDTSSIIWVTSVKRHAEGTFELKMKRDEGGDSVTTLLKCRMVVDPLEDQDASTAANNRRTTS